MPAIKSAAVASTTTTNLAVAIVDKAPRAALTIATSAGALFVLAYIEMAEEMGLKPTIDDVREAARRFARKFFESGNEMRAKGI